MDDQIDQVTYEEYSEEMYPTNCHGTFYLFSALVRNKLLQVFFSFVKCIVFKIQPNFYFFRNFRIWLYLGNEVSGRKKIILEVALHFTEIHFSLINVFCQTTLNV